MERGFFLLFPPLKFFPLPLYFNIDGCMFVYIPKVHLQTSVQCHFHILHISYISATLEMFLSEDCKNSMAEVLDIQLCQLFETTLGLVINFILFIDNVKYIWMILPIVFLYWWSAIQLTYHRFVLCIILFFQLFGFSSPIFECLLKF